MNLKYFIYQLVFVVTLVQLSCLFSLQASNKKNSSNIIIEIDLKNNNLELKKNLQDLVSVMQGAAKLYETSDRKAYWETEGQKAFLKLLNSKGYYQAQITPKFSNNNPNLIVFVISPNNRYRISKISIEYAANSNRNIRIPDITLLPIKEGDFAVTKKILSAQQDIDMFIEQNNCLLKYSVVNLAVVNHPRQSVEIAFVIDAFSEAYIKSVSFEGLQKTKSDYARKLVPIEDKQCYKNSTIAAAKTNLQRSGLFAATSFTAPSNTGNDKQVPVVFKVTERKIRSIKAGVNYATDFGIGINSGWEHRNLFGRGEGLKVNVAANKKERLLNSEFTKPFFQRDDQTLKISMALESKKLKAFDSKEGALFAGVERKASDIVTYGAGSKYSYSIIRDVIRSTRDFSLISAPLFVARDNRDNILDPHNGHLIKLETEAFFSTVKKKPNFVKNKLSGSSYIDFKDISFDPVLAFKASVGSILGSSNSVIPAIERFYVGGGSSIRGYAHQLVGAIDRNKRPLGGASFVETSLECRIKIKKDIGVVVFLDAGNVYTNAEPNFKTKLAKGAGIGVRYYTNFGPLRADIAFPLDRRKGVDKPFQLYFNIGQSF